MIRLSLGVGLTGACPVAASETTDSTERVKWWKYGNMDSILDDSGSSHSSGVDQL